MSREELRAKIPYGYNRIIAKKAGVHEVRVSVFLNGNSNSSKIEMAALEVVAELEQKKRGFINQIL